MASNTKPSAFAPRRPGTPQPPVAVDLTWSGIGLVATLLATFAVSHLDLQASATLLEWRGCEFGVIIQEWGTKPASLLVVAAATVLLTGTSVITRPLLARASAAVLVQMLIHPALVTNLLKLASGRPRPVDLGPGGEGFVQFFVFSPGIGDFSFPSGHVAVAMVLAPCAVVLWRERRPAAAAAVAAATCVWAGLVAAGRVLHGAHFPSDVVFSVGLALALAPLSLRIGDRVVDRLASRRMTGAATPRSRAH